MVVGLAFADEDAWHIRLGMFTSDSVFFDDYNKAGVILGASRERDIYDAEKMYPPTSSYTIMFFPHRDALEPDYWAPPYDKDYGQDYRPPIFAKEIWHMKFAMVYGGTRSVTVWWSEMQGVPPSYLPLFVSEDGDTINLFEQSEFTRDFPSGIHRWMLSVEPDYYSSHSIAPSAVTLHVGETAAFGLFLHNPPDSTRCQCAQFHFYGSGGAIDGEGVFTATSLGGGIVVASQGGEADSAEVTIVPGGGHNIPLRAGWNMISLPCDPASHLASDVLPGYAGNIYRFDNSTGNYVDADSILPGVGYFVLSTRDTIFELSGVPLDSVSMPLFVGWNLIGGPGNWADMSDFVSSPPGIIYHFPWVWLSSDYAEVDSVGPSQGFWVLCGSAGVLSIISD